MVDTNVYFATNRGRRAGVPGGYGDDLITDPAAVEFGVIPVTGTDITDSASGHIGTPSRVQAGGFDAATREAIISPDKNLLVFIHGFANSFEDAMKRAAFNRAWFAASGRAGADTTVLAFTWPSPGKVIGKNPLDPDEQYKTDRRKSGASGACIAAFLRHVLGVAAEQQARFGDARCFLLAHSMGNHALNGAVEAFFTAGPPPIPFDEAILAAADEFDTALEMPDHSGMYRLRDLARRISIYASGRDLALQVSLAVNGRVPLGLDGGDSEESATIYPPAKFRSVDCTMVFDLLKSDHEPAVDASHQYYRRSRCVREDMAKLMDNAAVKAGMSRLAALPL